MQLVADVVAVSGAEELVRQPIGDDIIVDLVIGWDFDELHAAFAPVANRLDPNARTLIVKSTVVLYALNWRSRWSRPKPFGCASKNVLVRTLDGSFSGRQIRSPAPVQMLSPSLSWISGRQSVAMRRLCFEYQNMLVSGAMPTRAISARGNSRASTAITVPAS